MNKEIYVVIGHDPKYDEHWTCSNEQHDSVFEDEKEAEKLCTILQSAEVNREYKYRVAKLSFLD